MIGKGSGAERKQLKELFAANGVRWQQTSNKTGYERSILERQSLSEVKTDSLPICKTNLLLQFQKIMTKPFNVLSSAILNILKRMRESGEIPFSLEI